ncbi:MAG: dephospho-CoA kinase [Bacillota bacterium]
MLVVGLTGGIASGKSTVSRILRQLGAEIIDADRVVKEIERPGTEVWRELVAEFGEGILRKDGSINRKRLARLAFPDPARLKRLNEIVHPRAIQLCQERLEEARRRHRRPPLLVLDAPLLIEANMTHMVDEVWVVAVGRETQIQRLIDRDHLSREEALHRLQAQMPLEEKLKYADRVIDTSGSLEETEKQVRGVWGEVVGRDA